MGSASMWGTVLDRSHLAVRFLVRHFDLLPLVIGTGGQEHDDGAFIRSCK